MQFYRSLAGVALGAALAVAALAEPARASQFAPLTLDGLTRGSEAVVRGKVVDVVSRWSDDQEAIFTYATVEVTRPVRGTVRSGEHIVIKEVGGTVDGFSVAAIGFPAFQVGDDLLVFLTRWADDGNYRVEGYAQGFYRVTRQRGAKAEVIEAGPVQDAPDQEPERVSLPLSPATSLEVAVDRIRSVRKP